MFPDKPQLIIHPPVLRSALVLTFCEFCEFRCRLSYLDNRRTLRTCGAVGNTGFDFRRFLSRRPRSSLTNRRKRSEEDDGASVGCGGGRIWEGRGVAVPGQLPLSSVSGDVPGAGDASLHTHLLQGDCTHTDTHSRTHHQETDSWMESQRFSKPSVGLF